MPGLSGLSLDLGSLGQLGIGDVLGAGAGLAGLAGGFIAASGAEQAGRAQAAAYLANAQIAGQNAGTAWQSYYQQKEGLDYRRNALEGRQRALYGAAGVNPGSGSPLDVIEDTEGQFSREALGLFYGAKARAGEAGMQAAADTEAAQAAGEAGKAKGGAAVLGGIGSALGIFGKIFGM